MFDGVFSRNLIKNNPYFDKCRFLSVVYSQINSKTHHF